MVVCICSICAYANTCNYDNVRVTLQESSVTPKSQNGNAAWVHITVSDRQVTQVRILVQCGNQRRDITVSLNNGSGMVNLNDHFGNLKAGVTYPVTLVNVPGLCF